MGRGRSVVGHRYQCRDHTHPFNEAMYILASWLVITKHFDDDGCGGSSMPQPTMPAWSVDVAVSADPPCDCGGNDIWQRGTRVSSV